MFTPIKNTKVYEQVIDQIQNMIMEGSLKKGDKLPSERDLCEILGVSRTSIREALKALQVVGLVESRQGEGNFIQENFENSLFQPLSVMFMLQESKPEEILELRTILEVQTAALAAENITSDEIEELNILINKLKESQDEENNVKIDKKFHYKIAQAAGNFLVLNILNAISSLMDVFIKDARKMILSKEENKEKLIEQHENIYKALANRNSIDASAAMKKHMDFTYENYTR